MSKVRIVRIQTPALAHFVVRNETRQKLFDMDVRGMAIVITTPLEAEIKIEPEERGY